MQIYDRVLVPINKTGILTKQVDGPVIVLTVEEAKAMWDKAEIGGYNEGKWAQGLNPNNFETYLQSKGIILP